MSEVAYMLQFLHQMFNLFALLRDDPLKPVTLLTNGAIDETHSHQQFTSLKWRLPASAGWLSWIVDVDKPSVEGHPKQHNRLDSSPGGLGATCEARWTWRLDVLMPQVRRCVPGCVWRRAVLLQTRVLHCIVHCRELRPYPEELDNNCF